VSEPIMVRMVHVRSLRWCAGGARTWLVHHHFDVHEFVTVGISAERFEATGDAFALAVAHLARAEACDGQ
jgi:hypothetical protein